MRGLNIRGVFDNSMMMMTLFWRKCVNEDVATELHSSCDQMQSIFTSRSAIKHCLVAPTKTATEMNGQYKNRDPRSSSLLWMQ